MKRLSISIIFLITGTVQAELQRGEVVRPVGHENFQCKLSQSVHLPKDLFIYNRAGSSGVTIAGSSYDFVCDDLKKICKRIGGREVCMEGPAICKSTDGKIVCTHDTIKREFIIGGQVYNAIDDARSGDYHCYFLDKNIPEDIATTHTAWDAVGEKGFICLSFLGIHELGYRKCIRPGDNRYCEKAI